MPLPLCCLILHNFGGTNIGNCSYAYQCSDDQVRSAKAQADLARDPACVVMPIRISTFKKIGICGRVDLARDAPNGNKARTAATHSIFKSLYARMAYKPDSVPRVAPDG